jgi:ribosome-binding protein aMBF1 (putative translation factor)
MSNQNNENWVTVSHNKNKNKTKPTTPTQESVSIPANEWEQVTVLKKRNVERPTKSQPTKITKPNTTYHTNIDSRKLDNSDSGGSLPTVNLSLGQLVQQERARQKLTQAQLVAKIGGKGKVTLSDLQQIEKGTAIKNEAKLSAIEYALNYRIRGKLAGQPLKAIRYHTDNKNVVDKLNKHGRK